MALSGVHDVSIDNGEVIEGRLFAMAARLVKQWALAHRGELEDNWLRFLASQPLAGIAGLDDNQIAQIEYLGGCRLRVFAAA